VSKTWLVTRVRRAPYAPMKQPCEPPVSAPNHVRWANGAQVCVFCRALGKQSTQRA
jgi:hypothetical protein